MKLKVVIPGGRGQIGTILSRAFVRDGHEVLVLSRTPGHGVTSGVRELAWDGRTLGPWAAELEGADVLLNLAGRSVNCRYTEANRREIFDSRIDSTRVLAAAVHAATRPPKVWLQASTATYYAHRFDAANDERTGILGGDEPNLPDTWKFSLEVAAAWEQAVMERGRLASTRVVFLRTAIAMSPDRGGAFDYLLRLVRYGLGGPAGNGRQYLSWIHDEDLIRAVNWIIQRDHLSGPINLASPFPIPHAEFMRGLRRAWGIPVGLPAFRPLLEIGCFLLRTESELILKSRRVVPGLLLEDGFQFKFPEWETAARDLCARWRGK